VSRAYAVASGTTIAGLLLGIGLAMNWTDERTLIYFPSADLLSPAAAGLPGAETVAIRTDDGLTLGGWFVAAALPATGVTVLVFNGNGNNRSTRAPLAARLAARGMATLLFDYRGYGGNPGAPSEQGLAADARAARAYLASRTDVDQDRVVYFGESLGSGVAVGLSVEQPPFALILRSPFTSLVDMGRHHYPLLPVESMLRDTFLSLDRIPSIQSPLLVIAGDGDTIVPIAQSRRLYDAALSPKELLVVEGLEHNDYELLAGPRVIAAIVGFINGLLPASDRSG
jgi:fermentation-respiration switch protein FrsA (DUF1100 family)